MAALQRSTAQLLEQILADLAGDPQAGAAEPPMALRSVFMTAGQGIPRSPSLYRKVAEDIKAAIAAGRAAR